MVKIYKDPPEVVKYRSKWDSKKCKRNKRTFEHEFILSSENKGNLKENPFYTNLVNKWFALYKCKYCGKHKYKIGKNKEDVVNY